MGGSLVQLAALVLLNGVPAVNVHGAVRVDGHHHLPDVGVDPPLLKPGTCREEEREFKKHMCIYIYTNNMRIMLCCYKNKTQNNVFLSVLDRRRFILQFEWFSHPPSASSETERFFFFCLSAFTKASAFKGVCLRVQVL